MSNYQAKGDLIFYVFNVDIILKLNADYFLKIKIFIFTMILCSFFFKLL